MLDFLIGNDILSALVAFGIVLIPAVIIHELGHFLVAKAVGITVLEFGVGFPPRVMKLFTWGETEFTLNWIPLGGFVRPLGEDFAKPVDSTEVEQTRQELVDRANHKTDDTQETSHYITEREELAQRGIFKTLAVNEAKPGARILFFASGAIANFITAILLFAIIGLLGVPEEVGSRVWIVDVAPESSFAEAGLQPDDFIESVNGQTLPDERDLISRINELSGEVITLGVIRSVEEELLSLEIVVEPDPDMTELWLSDQTYVRVLNVSEETPAADAGLMPNDLIAGVNDRNITEDEDPIQTLQRVGTDFAGREITLSVIRERELLSIELIPQRDPPPGVGRIGIGIDAAYGDGLAGMVYSDGAPQVEMVSLGIGQAISYGFDRTADVFELIAEFPSRLLQGDTEPGEARIISVVGVTQLGGELLQDSIEDDDPFMILQYIALISIALGFTNLLPIPALDGGRILFVLVEIVRGRPIPPEHEGIVHLAGLIFLFSIAVIFIINDLMNPLTDVLP